MCGVMILVFANEEDGSREALDNGGIACGMLPCGTVEFVVVAAISLVLVKCWSKLFASFGL